MFEHLALQSHHRVDRIIGEAGGEAGRLEIANDKLKSILETRTPLSRGDCHGINPT